MRAGLRDGGHAEAFDPTSFPTPEAARRAIFEYVEAFYNRQRRHSGLGLLTPAQAHEQMARAA